MRRWHSETARAVERRDRLRKIRMWSRMYQAEGLPKERCERNFRLFLEALCEGRECAVPKAALGGPEAGHEGR